MSIYLCSRCGYSHKVKSTFIRHLQRKYKCKSILTNIKTEEIYKKYFKNDKYKKPSISLRKPSISLQKPSISLQKPSISLRNPPKSSNICESCSASFTRKDNLKRHYKRCKVKKKEYDNLKELVDLLNNQLINKDKLKKIKVN